MATNVLNMYASGLRIEPAQNGFIVYCGETFVFPTLKETLKFIEKCLKEKENE